jgi:hypothetical protein
MDFFERPILNSPYEEPARHWELVDGLGRGRRLGQPPDAGRGAARHGLAQAVGAAAPPWARPRSSGRVQKKLPERLAEIRAELPAGTGLELWWQDEARPGQSEREKRPISPAPGFAETPRTAC